MQEGELEIAGGAVCGEDEGAMEFGACVLSSVPVRREPVSSSEMTSQLLFGEVFRVIGERSYFVEVEVGHDGYGGWIDRRQGIEIGREAFEDGCGWSGFRVAGLTAVASAGDGRRVVLLKGARLSAWADGAFDFGGERWDFEGEVSRVGETDPVEWGLEYEGVPYLWGGRSPFGLDCSGLVQVCWGMAGIGLGRDTGDMVKAGEEIGFGDVQAGDLVFSEAVADQGAHVGLVVPGGVLHASAQVRIDRLEAEGFVSVDTGRLTHRMGVIRRVATLGRP